MDLYREGLSYGSLSWKACTAYQKLTNIKEDR